MSKLIDFQAIIDAEKRIRAHVVTTPLVQSSRLNDWLGHEIYFKAEQLQRVGAFKARGGCNAIIQLLAKYKSVKGVHARSLGNHAQAVAWAANLFKVPATIYMPESVAAVKIQATRGYGAEVVFYDSAEEVDAIEQSVQQRAGHFWISPFNDPDVIAGQGTATMEAIGQMQKQAEALPDALFAPCGGGGLLSGMLVAGRELAPKAQVIGVEPAAANDSWRSLQAGHIVPLKKPSDSVADGARTHIIGDITFAHLQQLDDFITVPEDRIIYWTQWLQHLLKMHIEATSAMVMEAVVQWLRKQSTPKKVLVVLSGGNIDAAMMRRLWADDQLQSIPSL